MRTSTNKVRVPNPENFKFTKRWSLSLAHLIYFYLISILKRRKNVNCLHKKITIIIIIIFNRLMHKLAVIHCALGPLIHDIFYKFNCYFSITNCAWDQRLRFRHYVYNSPLVTKINKYFNTWWFIIMSRSMPH